MVSKRMKLGWKSVIGEDEGGGWEVYSVFVQGSGSLSSSFSRRSKANGLLVCSIEPVVNVWEVSMFV